MQGQHGGELILGEVFANGTRTGHRHWNRLPDGRHIDLTADQFRPDEAVVGGQVQQRPPGTPTMPRRARGAEAAGARRTVVPAFPPPGGHRRGPVEGCRRAEPRSRHTATPATRRGIDIDCTSRQAL
ncbi:YunG family protein [Micromonospora haikouensis]|uniref:YunG family protein n=1 Tax=Micromonospora haikouensis TaxID=686309 RepID=UPI003D7211C0